jgi:hypothetical protein
MLRLIGAVVAGYIIFAVLSVALFVIAGRDAHAMAPGWFIVGATVYGMLTAMVAGYAATRIAGRADLRAAVVLTVIIALGAVVSMIGTPAAASHWSQWVALLLMAPAAVLGGMLALRRRSTEAMQRG